MHEYVLYCVLAVAFCWMLTKIRRSGRRLGDFPGPRGWPLLGNLPQIENRKLHLNLTDWARKYGGIYKINLLGDEGLVISDPPGFNEFLVKRGAEFAGRAELYETICWSENQDLSFSQPNRAWKTMRLLGHRAIKMYDTGLERVEMATLDMFTDVLDELKGHAGTPVDLKPFLYRTTSNIVAIFMVGRCYPKDSEYHRIYSELDSHTFDLLLSRTQGAIMESLPFMKYIHDLLGDVSRKTQNSITEMHRFMQVECKKAEENGFTGGLVSILNQAVDASEITAANASYMISDLVIAGSITTTNTMYAFINTVINHPKIQRKLQDEADDVIGDRRVTLADRERMPYHMACLHELIRFTSIVGLGLPHRPVQDTCIHGQHVPANTKIYFNHFGLNHDAAYFPAPFHFRPERYLDAAGRVVPPDHPNRRNMNSFSAGPRVCFGETLARTRLFLLMASLSQTYDVSSDGTIVSNDPREYEFRFVLFPPTYKAVLTLRKE